MNPLLEYTIAFIIIGAVIVYSVWLVWDRILAERLLIDLVIKDLTFEKYSSLTDDEFIDYIESCTVNMTKNEYDVSMGGFKQDSILGRAAYMKKFRSCVEHELT